MKNLSLDQNEKTVITLASFEMNRYSLDMESEESPKAKVKLNLPFNVDHQEMLTQYL